ncbi:MAG TPA: hypothetical protein VN381_05725 [Anaerovoracaceae bacterium]|nr:hypothetical protein [Anaerovoracaceae bacterium]
MVWSIGITVGFVACTAAGIWLLRGCGSRAWSLKRRAYLRNGVAGGIMKYHGLASILEARKKDGPIETVIRRVRAFREKKMDREIFESITFLRNLASIEKGRNSSADSVIEKLAENNGLLRPVFIRMLNLLRINQPKEAAALFTQKVCTPAGRDFAGLLIQWDRLEPGELLETLLSYEKSMKAVRLTDQKRRDEIVSDLIYFPVVVNILVIFINFIYVAYFIDQKEMLQMFF